jgi:hypothetical protein
LGYAPGLHEDKASGLVQQVGSCGAAMKTISRRDLADCKRNLKQAYKICEELHGFFRRQSIETLRVSPSSLRDDNDEMVKYLDAALESILEAVNHLPDPREKV